MSMASGFVPSQRGKERWSILVDLLGACEVSHELGGSIAGPQTGTAALPRWVCQRFCRAPGH